MFHVPRIMNVNKVILVGRLTRDPEVRTTPAGQTVTSISIATSFNWTDKNGQKQSKAEYHNVILWRRLGEIAGQYMTKGQEVYIEGRLETRKYTDKSGIERWRTEIITDNMQLGSKPQGSSSFSKPYSPNTPAPSGPAKETPAEEIPTINLDEEEEVRIEDVPF
jgi:single-strand DNA-binding protein